jgi:hypothetical protein
MGNPLASFRLQEIMSFHNMIFLWHNLSSVEYNIAYTNMADIAVVIYAFKRCFKMP